MSVITAVIYSLLITIIVYNPEGDICWQANLHAHINCIQLQSNNSLASSQGYNLLQNAHQPEMFV